MITSAQNGKIKEVRLLTAKKKERDASGRYIVEGVRLTEEALLHAEDCVYLLYASPMSQRAECLVRAFSEKGVDTEEVSSDLMRSIADTDSPQGILAVMKKRPLPLPESPCFVVIADGLQDPGNLGTLFRTAAAAKADALLLMPGCADEYSPKVVRSAMGTHFRIPCARMDWRQAEIWLHDRGLRILAADSDGGVSCWEADLRQPIALVIGSEGNGPCEAALAAADARILIPMPGEVESLNAGIAAGILLFEVVRQRVEK